MKGSVGVRVQHGLSTCFTCGTPRFDFQNHIIPQVLLGVTCTRLPMHIRTLHLAGAAPEHHFGWLHKPIINKKLCDKVSK